MTALALTLLALATARPSAAEATDPLAGTDTLERDGLVALVVERNPSLAAARQAWEAARQRPVQVTALPDPTASWEVAPLTVGDGRIGQTLSAGQMIPYPGKLRLRGEAAAAEAESAFRDLETLRLDLALEAARSWDDWYLVHRALEINAEHERLLEELMTTATGRYAAGTVSQQDPLQAEVELGHVAHERLGLARQRDVVAARLNALLHRDAGAAVPPPAPTLERLGDLAEARRAVDSVDDEAVLAVRPELAAIDAEIRALEANAGLARLERRPDFGIMGSYNSMFGERDMRWMAGVSVNLPVRRDKLAAAEAEADARLAAARSRRAAFVDSMLADLRTARLRLSESIDVATLYESRLVPASRDRVAAARSAFETGRADFPTVIEAERNLRTVELGLHEALAEVDRRRAELARAAGTMPAGETPAPLTPSIPPAPATAVAEGDAR